MQKPQSASMEQTSILERMETKLEELGELKGRLEELGELKSRFDDLGELKGRLEELGDFKRQMKGLELRLNRVEVDRAPDPQVHNVPDQQSRGQTEDAVGVALTSTPPLPSTVEAHPVVGAPRPPLVDAAARGDREAVQRLLQNGAHADATDDDGRTALLVAAAGGHVAAMEALLEGGADVSIRGPRLRSPLHVAALNVHLAAVQLLLKWKADVNAKDAQRNSSVHFAAAGGHKDVVAALLQSGAEPNSNDLKGQTALLLAAKAQHWDIVSLLLEKGAELIANPEGECALFFACQHGNMQAVRSLLRCFLWKNNVWYDAASATLGWRVAANGAVVWELASSHSLPLGSSEFAIALCCAASDGRLSALKALLELGVNPRTKNNQQEQALYLAAAGSHIECCNALLDAVVDTATRKLMCNEALFTAAQENKVLAVRMLLGFGADANYKDQSGQTPLCVASARGHTACVSELQGSAENIGPEQ